MAYAVAASDGRSARSVASVANRPIVAKRRETDASPAYSYTRIVPRDRPSSYKKILPVVRRPIVNDRISRHCQRTFVIRIGEIPLEPVSF